MKQVQLVRFVIVTYKPDVAVLTTLRKNLEGKPVIEIDNTQHNVGYGGGANAGIRRALARGAEWVVILNQDIEISTKALDDLSDTLSHCRPGILGPFAGKLDKKRWTSILGKGTDYISGSFMAIHKSVINKIGMFHEPYFMYYEDADYCIRARKAGFTLTHIAVSLTHSDGTTFGQGSFLHQYYLARNHLLFVKRNAPLKVQLHEMIRMPKTLWEHYQKKEYGALEGIKDFALGKFGKKEGTL